VRFHCPACGDGIDDDSDVLDYEQHLGIEYDEWGVPNENNNIELAKLYSIGLGVSVQQHLSVCCPDVLAHAQDQVLDMKSSNRGRHKQHDYGGEHDSFDGGGPLRGWLCVGCGRHFGRAGYGYYCTNYIHVLNTLMQRKSYISLCLPVGIWLRAGAAGAQKQKRSGWTIMRNMLAAVTMQCGFPSL
jgi:hypothetical protein